MNNADTTIDKILGNIVIYIICHLEEHLTSNKISIIHQLQLLSSIEQKENNARVKTCCGVRSILIPSGVTALKTKVKQLL